MSLTNVRTYLKGRMSTLNLKEHPDPIDPNNISRTQLERVYFLDTRNATATRRTMTLIEVSMPVSIHIAKKGYRNVTEGMDAIWADVESVINAMVIDTQSKTQNNIKNIVFDDCNIEPVGDTNDSILIAEIGFTVEVLLDPNNA